MGLPVPLSTLLAVPIPETYREEGEQVQAAVEQAIKEMFAQKIDRSGKDVSPWLLKRVGELTGDIALDLSKSFRKAFLWAA
jgi:pseudouridine-5'-phosphate glycosidase/pseudouridine kinase